MESWFRLILEAAPSAMIVAERGRIIVLMSDGAQQLLGYGREELVGRELELLFPDGFGALGREHVVRRKDGRSVAVEIDLNSIETPEGRFTLVSMADIAPRIRREDELRRSREDLEQFAYMASHDLQEPLRMVASFTELLAQRYQGKLDERADKYIFYAVDGAKRMQQLLADLLTYSRVSSQGKPLLPVSAEAVVKSAIAKLDVAIRRTSATISVGRLPTVQADEGQLRQLFLHLLDNALKFSGEAPALVEISVAPRDDQWQFAVKDNGIGIDHQGRERIFQMFQRLHERGKYEGNGAGLAIAKRIVERHGGRIWLESEPGLGSTVCFTLHGAPVPEQP